MGLQRVRKGGIGEGGSKGAEKRGRRIGQGKEKKERTGYWRGEERRRILKRVKRAKERELQEEKGKNKSIYSGT